MNPEPAAQDPAVQADAATGAHPLADAVPPAAVSPGAMLRSAREARGLSCADIAQRLKFSARQIEALESDDYASLSGATMVKGMLRGYAREVGLDPDPVLAAFHGRHIPSEITVDLRTERIPFPDGAQKGNRAYLILSVLIVIAAAGVIYEWQFAPGLFSQEPAAVKLDAQPVATTPAGPEQGTPVAEVPATVAAPVPALVAPPAAATPPAAPSAPLAPAALGAGLAQPATVPLARQDAAGSQALQAARAAEARIRLEFGKDAWVEIRDRGGRTLLSQMNPAGSERMVEGRPPFDLVIGNAPNVRLHYNDQPVDLKPYFRVDVARLTLP